MNDKLNEIFIKKPYLAWDIGDTSVLSEKSMVEHIFCYGNWDDVKQVFSVLGVDKTAEIFNETIKGFRNNYRPETLNFFKLYFSKNA